MMRKPGIYQASQHEKQKMEALMRAKGISYGPETEFGVRYVKGSKYSPEEMKIENAAARDAAFKILSTRRHHGAAILRYQSADLLEADWPRIIKRNFYKPIGQNHYSMQLKVFGINTKSHLLRISPTEVLMVNDMTSMCTYNPLFEFIS